MLPFTTVSLSPSTSSLNYRLYPSRFYVLFVFCFLAFNQCLFWLTFSPISQSTQKYYRVNESTVNLLLNWGPIIFIPFLPLTYILLNKENGFQKTVRILAWTCFLAAAVRLLPSYIPLERDPDDKSFAVLCIHLGQILNAACGPLVMAPVSQLSSLWFGSNERTRATTVAIMAASLGSTVAFVISPWIVAQPEDIVKLLHIHFILAAVAFVLTLIYLPSQPPSPPSLAAQSLMENAVNEQHQNSFGNYLDHVYQCFQNRSFVYLCSIGGLLSGAFAAWTSLFANTLAPENFTEQQAGWLGFSASLAAIIGGLLSSILADSHQFRQSFKLIIVTTLICCFLSLLWFQLSVRTIFFDYPIFQPSLLSITLCVALAGFFQGSSLPLIYEALAETMFPLPESLSASVLVQLTNVTALILIFIPPSYYKLMNFSVILLVVFCILMASVVQIDYRRRNEEERKQ